MMSNEYIAGLFDGEGTVGIYPIHRVKKLTGEKISYWNVKLSITGTHKPMIQKLRLVTGIGAFNVQKLQGKTVETPSRIYEDMSGFRQGWKWNVSNKKDIKEFLISIQPFLYEKADQVNIVLKYLSGEMDSEIAASLCKAAKKFSFPYIDGDEIPVTTRADSPTKGMKMKDPPWNKGKKMSPEARANMSKAAIKRHSNK